MKILMRLTFVVFVFAPLYAAAQDRSSVERSLSQNAAPGATDSLGRITADEAFDLNIVERRITRTNYQSSTSVETNGEEARGVNVRVGVVFMGDRVDVLLRGVQGRVRFRATLNELLQRIMPVVAPRESVAPFTP